jgi:CxxC motif-containing protein (DUF1111 family)
MKRILYLFALLPLLTACSDDSSEALSDLGPLTPADEVFGKATGNFTADEWYPGGKLGTTDKASYSALTPAAEQAGMENDFNVGEDFFEHLYTYDQEPRKGLGPAWVRNSCIACHPSYGHGKRQTEYRANQIGNGYLLVIYHPDNNAYISEVTGMPQTQAMAPFKAPINEDLISIEWKEVTAMESGLPLQFEDGERYSLIYPEVRIPQEAFNTNPKPTNYDVRLESTIGVYGTGLLDAISADDMKAQYQQEASHGVQLNPAIWDTANNDWASTAWYTLADGTKQVKKFTYAMTRASLQDGAGANAIWNITNVSRSDRPKLYTTAAWAQAMSEDADVIATIKADPASPYYADGTNAGISDAVRHLLDPSTNQFDNQWHNSQPEMSDKQYYQFMVWHRGLAVPAARNLNSSDVQRGKELFTEIGCARCHRPSWTTGEDTPWVDASIKAYASTLGKDYSSMLPRYPKQVIWPYTDMVQHRLFMMNDIRTGWCRTTPLWGRGLSRRLTGADDRLHDCRARNVIEAIMWHGYSKQSDAYKPTEKFFHLSKADRNAVVMFLESI